MSKSLEKGMAVLELLDETPAGLGVREMARRLDMPASNVQRLVTTFEKLSYVEKIETSRTYRLSFKAYFLGQSALRSDRLAIAASPEIERLASEHNVCGYLSVRHQDRAVYVQVNETHGIVSTHMAPGASIPLHTTAMGKILLSALGDDEIRGLLGPGPLLALTSKSVTDVEALLGDIRQVREKGMAFIVEENIYGIASLAAPILNYTGRMVAALSVAIPTSSKVDEDFERLSRVVAGAARRISVACGYEAGAQDQ